MSGFSCLATRFSMIVGIITATAIAVPDAHASAIGFEAVPAFDVDVNAVFPGVELGKNVTVPAGFLWHSIDGDDRKIASEVAWYDTTAIGQLKNKVCNWRIDFVYRDVNGHEYKRERGKAVPACSGVLKFAAAGARRKTLARYGAACAQLFSNGKRLATQCHNITR